MTFSNKSMHGGCDLIQIGDYSLFISAKLRGDIHSETR